MSTITEPTSAVASNAPSAADELYEARNEGLALPGGRTLSYSHSGPPDSELVVLWCHGLFSVGDTAKPNQAFRKRGVHFIAADLPGWGGTSPMPSGATFPETFLADLRALFEHLYPAYDAATSKLRIYVAGGSFGTCPAQIVCGAPYDRFPYGRQIVALLLAAPMTPFHEDVHYGRSLTWRDWVSVGPPTRVLSFNLLARVMKLAIQSKLKDVPAAEKLLRAMYFDHMTDEEKVHFAAWRERTGAQEGAFERRMAEGMVKSVSKSWAGFLGTADALHADWGFKIEDLDEEHAKKRVVVIVGTGDTSMFMMSRYLVDNYKNSKVVEIEGGHLAGAWSMDKIWEDTLAELEGRSPSA
ncbi:alpha/beta-hydrolase [Lentinus brumalis]|uniref:Alpha/beta-hydrolase n=1 Tax=Lentinus brumalis TaxID=2498619 RepID=A0A371DY36_9APHY|nr:alpha/beta-hydrolase [Polyporus brumalis]